MAAIKQILYVVAHDAKVSVSFFICPYSGADDKKARKAKAAAGIKRSGALLLSLRIFSLYSVVGMSINVWQGYASIYPADDPRISVRWG